MAGERNAHAWIARGGALGFVGAATSALAGFALTVVVSRGLGAHGAGIVMQSIAVFSMLMALTKVGMDSTAIFLLPRIRHDNPHALSAHIRFMALTTLAISSVTALALWALAPHIWDEAAPELSRAIRAVSWFLPAGSLAVTAAAAMRALGSMGTYVLTHNVALPMLRLAAVASAVAFTGAALSVTLAWAVPLLLICLVSGWILRAQVQSLCVTPECGAMEKRGTLTRAERRTILSYAAPRTLTAGLEQGLVWIDVLLVGHLAGAASAGIYSGASRFIQAGMIVDTALRVVVSPKLSTLIHRGHTTELQRIHQTTTMWLILFASPIYVLMAVFSPTIMSLLGEDFVPAASALTILSIAMAITYCAGNIHTMLLMSGHSGWAAVNKIIVLAINVIGNIVFIPLGGISAAALVWAASMLVDALLATVQVAYFVGVTLRPNIYVTPVAIVTLTVLLPAATIAGTLGQGVGQCALATALSVALFVMACVRWREAVELHHLRR